MANIESISQHLLPQHALSRLVGKLINCQQQRLKNWVIKKFIHHFKVDMSEALEPCPTKYKSFNDFFTRQLRPGARTIAADETAIACPNDGFISQLGDIKEGKIFQAKGHDYSLFELIGGDDDIARAFTGGKFATLYLSPKDYHRVHMPLSGCLKSMTYIPGSLFPVKPSIVANVPNLFARNERVVCIFQTAIGPMAVILVGAMIVASIHTTWAGQMAPNTSKQITHVEYTNDPNKISIEKGKEMGHFELGSTVIVLFPENKIEWDADLQADIDIRLGQALGRIIS